MDTFLHFTWNSLYLKSVKKKSDDKNGIRTNNEDKKKIENPNIRCLAQIQFRMVYSIKAIVSFVHKNVIDCIENYQTIYCFVTIHI